ncbi:MAG: Crp/Fnr family transcriptional regulator [Sulfurovum sp.]|nr:Crp/Fnr family transcriptional regulator [Sulfurovum sp.]
MTHYIEQNFTYTLKDIPLFCGLSDVQLQDLQSDTIVKNYTKESILFYEGEKSPYIHILLEGRVKLYKTGPSGKEVYLHHAEAPCVIAMGPALEGRSFPASCAFEVEGVVGTLALEKFHMCLENLECTVAIIATMAGRMKDLERRLHTETIFSSEAKVADFILKNAILFERLKNTEIASILNMTPETFSRILTKFKKKNLIALAQHHITIIDEDALLRVIDTNTLEDKQLSEFKSCCNIK